MDHTQENEMRENTQNGNKAVIWDLDGTLLDSYDVIVTSLYKTFREFGIELDKDEIHKKIIGKTVVDLFAEITDQYEIDLDAVRQRNAEISDAVKLEIKPVRHAAEILTFIRDCHIPNYVFTHRGASTEIVLKNTGLYDYFDEIVTGRDGFGRKPDPSALNYLVRKYSLDPDQTYYAGDRSIDVDCAVNAGVKSILYMPEDSVTQPTGRETFIVKDLLEIEDILLRA